MENYPVPLILKCCITGQEVKYYSRPYIEKRIVKAGSLDRLLNTFMIKGAKNKTKVFKPSLTKTWNKKDIIKQDNKTDISEKNVHSEILYKFKDGGQCRVSYN